MNVKLLRALFTLTLTLFILHFAPQIYYAVILPAERSILESSNTKQAFANWNLVSNEEMPAKQEIPSAAFTCSVCYPEQHDSQTCRDKMAFWVARSLIADQGAQRPLVFHVKTYFLTKAILSSYSEDSQLRLYAAFVARSLRSKNIGTVCIQEFGRSCSDLTPSESIELGIKTRLGSRTHSQVTQKLDAEIAKACLVPSSDL